MATDFTTGAKQFLTRDEKATGYLTTALLVFGTGSLAWIARDAILGFLDFSISFLGKTIALGALGVVAYMMAMLLMSERFWTEMRHLQYRIARTASRIAMKADPFGRMRAFANEYLQEQLDEFNAVSVEVEAQKGNVETDIAEMEKTLKASAQQARSLRERYCDAQGTWSDEEAYNQFRLESQRVLLTEESLAQSKSEHTRLAALVKIVDRWRHTFKFQIDSTRMEAEIKERRFKSANSTSSALRRIGSAFGQGDMAKAHAEVNEYIDELTNTRIAEASVLMKQIPELTKLGDLKGDAAADEIMARLKAFDNASQQALADVKEHRAIAAGDAGIEVFEPKTATKSYLSKANRFSR